MMQHAASFATRRHLHLRSGTLPPHRLVYLAFVKKYLIPPPTIVSMHQVPTFFSGALTRRISCRTATDQAQWNARRNRRSPALCVCPLPYGFDPCVEKNAWQYEMSKTIKTFHEPVLK